MNKEYIKKSIQKAEEIVCSINYKCLTTSVDDKLISAMGYIIQALKGLKELEDYDTKADMEGRNQDFNN